MSEYVYAVEIRPLGGDRIDIRFKVRGKWVQETRNLVLVPGQDMVFILDDSLPSEESA